MDPSGKHAETGEGLRKRFKKAVVAGGRHKGAKYNDLPDAELHRCAKSYRGDPRFLQFCRQWSSLQLLASDESIDGGQKKDGSSQRSGWFPFMTAHLFNFWSVLGRFAKVHLALSLLIALAFFFVISRPSFSHLCSKLLVLAVRRVVAYVYTFATTLIDGILNEAVQQVDIALRPVPLIAEAPQTMQHRPAPTPQTMSDNPAPSWLLHVFSMIMGAWLGRHYGPGLNNRNL